MKKEEVVKDISNIVRTKLENYDASGLYRRRVVPVGNELLEEIIANIIIEHSGYLNGEEMTPTRIYNIKETIDNTRPEYQNPDSYRTLIAPSVQIIRGHGIDEEHFMEQNVNAIKNIIIDIAIDIYGKEKGQIDAIIGVKNTKSPTKKDKRLQKK